MVLGVLEPDLAGLAPAAVYAVVLGFVFLESGVLLGLVLPGDSLLFGAGLVAAHPSSGISMPLLAVGVAVAAVAGDAVGYTTGRRLGRPWLERRITGGRLSKRHLDRAERFYARWGWWAVVSARWIPWVRTLTPILAGTSHMPYAQFASANVVGALSWGAGLVVLGYYAASIPELRTASYVLAGTAVALAAVALLVGLLRRRAAAGR